MVNERGMLQNGEIKIVRPHPNFRIFLAMDPKSGEISRAMRNRGIELFVDEIDVRSQDGALMLAAAGVPGHKLPLAMTEFHAAIGQTQLPGEVSFTVRDLCFWGALAVEQLQRGVSLERAVTESMTQVYVRNRHQSQAHAALELLRGVFSRHFAAADAGLPQVTKSPTFVKGVRYSLERVEFCSMNQFITIHFLSLI